MMYDESLDSPLLDAPLEDSMTASADNIQHNVSDASDHQSESEPTPSTIQKKYPDAPLELTLNAGRISASFDELSQLNIGSVLVATGEKAGYATVYHQQQAIARGELVNVEGRLGIQITHVFLDSQSQSALSASHASDHQIQP
ncbi:FliM/FliN family flagellar motor switch protein [Marinomonas mediterranea]|uniref:FliM/FliN family flagellar motor switch protein n=1 Tax=Marinomonas mediterranea TaxID=119864 RepID=UPI00234B1D01|nr:FliM/FliN family flagellar motor switch protein [Marinomonas mediterranea]WCN08404.1 hypothetical protein GV055_05455 [Marinomonas mediterranea]WCN12459.1 hypothetical protein GV054_05295 [Marinomonas mediterranea]